MHLSIVPRTSVPADLLIDDSHVVRQVSHFLKPGSWDDKDRLDKFLPDAGRVVRL